ncbi:MAG: response regulator transcription factor, partial [Gaiellaceae bacterium]
MQNVLLAEPEPAARGFLERHLRQDGFEVVEAEDGEALELLERSQPDVVLVSDELALDLCARLREGEPGRSWDRDLPVIVLGGQQADAVDRVRAFARGCDDFVVRPFHYDELVARIRAVGQVHGRNAEAGGRDQEVAHHRRWGADVDVGG